jgi:hypothetical protein
MTDLFHEADAGLSPFFFFFLFFSFFSLESSFFLSLFFFNKIFVWCWISIIDNITDLAHG